MKKHLSLFMLFATGIGCLATEQKLNSIESISQDIITQMAMEIINQPDIIKKLNDIKSNAIIIKSLEQTVFKQECLELLSLIALNVTIKSKRNNSIANGVFDCVVNEIVKDLPVNIKSMFIELAENKTELLKKIKVQLAVLARAIKNQSTHIQKNN